MARASQRKGRRNELALAKLLEEKGHTVRPHSQWEANDLTVDGEQVEVKVRANGFGMFYDLFDKGIVTVYCKADRKKWIKIKIEEV